MAGSRRIGGAVSNGPLPDRGDRPDGPLVDELTGLGNFRALRERFDELSRSKEPFALCLADVARMQGLQGWQGFSATDALLAELAQLVRRFGEAFRCGGDEFVLVLPGLDAEAARLVAGRLALAVLGERFGPGRVPADFRIGIVAYPEHGSDPQELLCAAKAAQEWSKRHPAVIYRPEMT